MLNILLVEDDEFFRQAIRQLLEEEHKWTVTEAPDGRAARDILKASKSFDLVISDIQMPHLTGVELLQWSKENKPTPFILMTGFALIMETQKAHDLGADDFLTKPFDSDELIKVVKRVCGNKLNIAPPAPSDPHGHELYCKVSLEEFVSSKTIAFDVYVKLGERYLKIGHKGDSIPTERIQKYKEKGLRHLFVRKEDFRTLVSFNLGVSKIILASNQVSLEKKANFLRFTGEVILEKAFISGMDQEAFGEAKDFLNSSMNVLSDDPMALEILLSLNSHSDHIYAHSLCVSIYSMMIARKMGWTSTANLFKLSLAGIFHDIGKKEIDRSLLDKPRPLLTYAERQTIETHPTRGRDILLALKQIPAEAVAVAYEHHEDNLGGGFPRRINKLTIHPFTQIVRVANLFAEFTLKGPNYTPMSPESAIMHVATHYKDLISIEPYKGLVSLFKISKLTTSA